MNTLSLYFPSQLCFCLINKRKSFREKYYFASWGLVRKVITDWNWRTARDFTLFTLSNGPAKKQAEKQ